MMGILDSMFLKKRCFLGWYLGHGAWEFHGIGCMGYQK